MLPVMKKMVKIMIGEKENEKLNAFSLSNNTRYLWVICHHFFSPGIKLNEFGLGLGLGLVTTFFKIYSLGGHSCNTNPNPNPNSF